MNLERLRKRAQASNEESKSLAEEKKELDAHFDEYSASFKARLDQIDFAAIDFEEKFEPLKKEMFLFYGEYSFDAEILNMDIRDHNRRLARLKKDIGRLDDKDSEKERS
ncbi:hypothetical protein MUP77_19650 [Candidatus Bathyarchaeota archaeon]|nr:hypothetical protein [Candidatus Bathyarchaeota archaeon]